MQQQDKITLPNKQIIKTSKFYHSQLSSEATCRKAVAKQQVTFI